MAKQPYSTNKTKANQVKNETVPEANSALRVGGFLADLNDSTIQEFDPTAAYVAGQIVVFEGSLAQTVDATTAGQTPITHAAKWSRKIVVSSSGITLGNFNPVSAHALAEFVEDGGFGEGGGESPFVPDAATTQEIDEGVRQDVYIAPKQIKEYLTPLLENVGNKTLQEVITAGEVATTAPKFNGGLYATLPDPPAGLSILTVSVDPLTGKFYKAAGQPGQADKVEWIIDAIYEEVALPPSLTVDLSNSDFVPDATSNTRIVGPATVLEGSAGQYGVEQQLSDGTWIPYNGLITWSTVSLPSGGSISTSGLLTIAADSVTADTNMAIHAAVLGSVLEYSVTVSNTAPSIIGYHISGPSTIGEGSTSPMYYVIIDYSDGSTLIYTGGGTWSMISDTTSMVVDSPTSVGTTLTSPPNAVNADTTTSLRFTFPALGGVIGKEITVLNTPCTTHLMLNQAGLDALPALYIWEYVAAGVPYGGLPNTVRAFASRSEAIANLSTNSGTHANADGSAHCTTSVCAVGNVLYSDNRPDHITAGTNQFYPVEAGWWGFDRNLPSGDDPGYVVVIQTNACGEIISRETITIPA